MKKDTHIKCSNISIAVDFKEMEGHAHIHTYIDREN
jgi:hypothetical protein